MNDGGLKETVPQDWQNLVEQFGRTVTDMFEQMERGKWTDDLGHDVKLNTAMLALQEPVVEAIRLRAMLTARQAKEGEK